MRAIAQYAQFSIQIRPQRQIGMGDGSVQITQQPLYAKFDPDGFLYENEIERAEKYFSFPGRTQHIDEATPSDIRPRLSLLDTQEQDWDEETREQVEAELRRKEKINDSFFIMEETPIAAPYPAWDTSEKPGFEMVAGLVEMGYDLQLALDYEKLFGRRRANLIEALEETIRDREQETITA
jgi:hypothetical protein